MKEMTANAVRDNPRLNKYMIPAIILVFVLLVGLFAYRSLNKPESVVISSGMTEVSPSILEDKYGLRVNLVAVTAAGGLVDVRLKIVDGGKAQALLQDPNNLPALWVPDMDITLTLPDEARSQEINFEDNGNIFLMYPNTRNAVKPGTPLTVMFGDLALEPIIAK